MAKLIVILGLLLPATGFAGEQVMLKSSGVEVLGYQAEPMSNPNGGKWDPELFKVDHFIHPLKTPSGFVLTESNPEDHPHHLGLWWPWKEIQNGDRKLITWDVQTKQGFVRAVSNRQEGNKLIAEAEYVDRLAEGGEEVLLKETSVIEVSQTVDAPARGYFLDITITQTPAVDRVVTVPVYRYSGFSLRSTLFWDKDNSSLLTSEGKTRTDGNSTNARWVRLQGANPEGSEAGVILMTHPENCNYPEQIRIWNHKWYNGALFVNFNPVMSETWDLEPGKDYTRKYRLFVYDGEVSAKQADALQQAYAATAPQKFFVFDNGLTDVKTPAEQAKLLKKLGYDGICTRPGKGTPEWLAAFDKEGVDVMATYVVLPVKNPEIPEPVKKHIEMLKGRDTMIWLSLTGQSSDDTAAELVRKVYALAKVNGLETVLYPHVNFRIDTVASAEKIRQLAECPGLGISFNVCHFLAQNDESKLEETIRSMGPHIKLVQVSGANSIPAPKADWAQLILPLGEGNFDMNRVFNTLDEVGYRGPINLQCYKVPGAAEDHLTKSINTWRTYNEQP